MQSQTDRLASAFCDRSLPRSEWCHYAHLKVGLWHLLRYPPSDALDLLRDRIRLYNAACGVTNTTSSGYHESLTRFYVWAIDQFLIGAGRDRPDDALAEELIQRCGDRLLPLNYWSRERLMSVEARLGWVEPDLRPLA